MRKVMCLALLVCLCAACATPTRSFPGRYDQTSRVYANPVAGFRLTLPERWTVITAPGRFTLHHDLRPDQEKVLEAYGPGAQIGLVIVVQQGPVIAIADLVRSMQAVPPEQLAGALQRPDATDFQQHSIRAVRLHGHEAAEWIYSARDMTGGIAEVMMVSSYIVQVKQHYVYITFAVASARYASAQPAIASILATFGPAAEA